MDSGDEDSDAEAGAAAPYEDSDEDEDSETAAEKRLRLAKEFISRIEDEERNKVDGHDVDAEAIAHRLRDDLSNEKGTHTFFFGTWREARCFFLWFFFGGRTSGFELLG